MAYPYGSLATGKADGTNLQTDHPAHHNALASALNDLLAELGSDPGGASDVTARLAALEAGIGAGAELTANKNIAGGYVGIDATTGSAQNNRLPPERRFSYPQRALSMFLGNVGAAVVKELWITDSMGHQGSSTAETTSGPARYEAEMARAFNTAPRSSGYQPVELWNGLTVTSDGAMAWDDIPAGQHAARGSCLANKAINAGQHATTTRGPATGVTVFYTAYQTGGAVVTVSINGFTGTTVSAGSNGVNTSTFAGAGTLNVADSSSQVWPSAGVILVATGTTPAVITYTGKSGTTFTGCTTISGGGVLATGGSVNPAIDNRDGTLSAGTFDSGRSVTFLNPSNSTSGDIAITLTHAAIGTTFELDSGYWHSFNTSSGHMLMRSSRSGIQIATWADATQGLPLHQFIKNQQPHVITILCGVNDAAPSAGNASAATVAASLTALLVKIRAQYATWTPAIRYVFQNDSTYVPSAWPTTYREALRNVCTANDVIFIDGNEAVGPIRVSDNLDFSDDALHPNDKGHRAWGLMMGSVSTNASTIRLNNVTLSATNPQPITAIGDRLTFTATSNPALNLLRDNKVALSNGNQLGYYGFRGAVDAFGTASDIAAAVAAVAEAGYTTSAWKTGLRFYTTQTNSPIIQGGLSGDGDLWLGATALANATWQVSAAGATLANGSTKMIGGLQVGQQSSALYQAEVYNFASQPILTLRQAQGTRSVPSATLTPNNIGSIYFEGYQTVTGAYTTAGGARITAVASQNFTDLLQGTQLRFYTTPSGTAAVTEAVRVDSSAVPNMRLVGGISVGGLTTVATGVAVDVVSGGLVAVRQSTVTLANGANANVTLPTSSFVFVTGPSAAFQITGIATPTNGMWLTIVNLTGFNMGLNHEDAGSTAANRITSLTGATQTTTGNGSVMLYYDTGTSRWILIDFQG